MEAAGLAVAIVGISGLFNNAIQCFEFIQIGRNFGKSFQANQLRLDNAELRLSRWGKSLGLSEDLEGGPWALEQRFSPQPIEHARSSLGKILELFADAEKLSAKYKTRTTPADGQLAVYSPQIDLQPAIADLHVKMNQLAVSRQNKSGILQKAKWALFEEKTARRLVEDITALIDGLVETFPQAEESQRELCDTEVTTVSTQENVQVLGDIAAEQDKFLKDAISKAMGQESSVHNITFSGNANAGFQMGHNSGTNTGLSPGKMD